MTVIEFLSAQLDQEEALARAATSGPWEAGAVGQAGLHVVRPAGSCEWVSQVTRRDRAEQAADASHIARHDPTRALREVQAKRAILAKAQAAASDAAMAWDFILGQLAAVYADHPDFQGDWLPPELDDRQAGGEPGQRAAS